jgi:hypothetical protein
MLTCKHNEGMICENSHHMIAYELFKECDPFLGVKPHTLVGDISFFIGDVFGTFVEYVLCVKSLDLGGVRGKRGSDERTCADNSAACNAVSRLEVMYNHGYNCAATCNGSFVRDRADSTVRGKATDVLAIYQYVFGNKLRLLTLALEDGVAETARVALVLLSGTLRVLLEGLTYPPVEVIV